MEAVFGLESREVGAARRELEKGRSWRGRDGVVVRTGRRWRGEAVGFVRWWRPAREMVESAIVAERRHVGLWLRCGADLLEEDQVESSSSKEKENCLQLAHFPIHLTFVWKERTWQDPRRPTKTHEVI